MKRPPRPLVATYRLFEGHKWRLGFSAFMYVIKYMPVWLMPILAADMVNVAVNRLGNPIGHLLFDGGLFLLVLLIHVPAHVFHARALSEIVRRIEVELRHRLVHKLHQLSLVMIQEQHSGALQSKLLRDVETVQGLCNLFVNLFFASTMNLIVGIGVTLYKEPMFCVFYLFAIPSAVAIARMFKAPISLNNRKFRMQFERLSARMTEMISLLPVTRAHGLEDVEVRRIDRQLDRVERRALEMDLVLSLFGSATWAFWQFMQMSCLLVAACFAVRGVILPGDVILYQSLFAMMVGAVNQIIDGMPAISKGFESVKSLGEILDSSDVELNEGKLGVRYVEGRFTLEDVSYTYPGAREPSIREVNLTIEPGEIVAVVGESGSGKTTLMSLLIGFRRPTSGRILLDDLDMNLLDLRQYRHHLAVVLQQPILFAASLRDNITHGLKDVSEERLMEVVRMARVDEFISRLPKGLDTNVGEHGDKLSGGQRQRVAIARALIRNPSVIILDEATSALDVVSERLVQEAIDQMIKGRTTFIVAHRLSTIRAAKKVLVMKDGRVVEMGPPDELIARGGEFAKLKSLQA